MNYALFRSHNLIGDALTIAPALNAWCKRAVADGSKWMVDIVTQRDHCTPLYYRMGIPNVRVLTEGQEGEDGIILRGHYDFEHTFDIVQAFRVGDQEKISMPEAYALLLGVELESKELVCYPALLPKEVEAWVDKRKGMILLSLFSRSCASQEGKPPNKMLPLWKWKPILRYLRNFELPIGVLGGPDDRADELQFSEEEYLTGLPLNTVAWLLAYARLLVTIDNGMSHLGATQSVPTFLLYPACLGLHWAVPWGNPNVLPLQIDPATVMPEEVLWAMRKEVPRLLAIKE